MDKSPSVHDNVIRFRPSTTARCRPGPVRSNQLEVWPVGFVDGCVINNQVAGVKLDQILDFLPSDLRLRVEASEQTGVGVMGYGTPIGARNFRTRNYLRRRRSAIGYSSLHWIWVDSLLCSHLNLISIWSLCLILWPIALVL